MHFHLITLTILISFLFRHFQKIFAVKAEYNLQIWKVLLYPIYVYFDAFLLSHISTTSFFFFQTFEGLKFFADTQTRTTIQCKELINTMKIVMLNCSYLQNTRRKAIISMILKFGLYDPSIHYARCILTPWANLPIWIARHKFSRGYPLFR